MARYNAALKQEEPNYLGLGPALPGQRARRLTIRASDRGSWKDTKSILGAPVVGIKQDA